MNKVLKGFQCIARIYEFFAKSEESRELFDYLSCNL